MFFGIRNHENDLPIINLDSHSNFLKPEVEMLLPRLQNGEMVNVPMIPNDNGSQNQVQVMPNLFTPLLLEHRANLTLLWKDFKSHSIITNRRTLRSLMKNSNFELQLQAIEIIIENERKIFYILNGDPRTFSNDYIDHVTTTLVQSDNQYTDYCYKKINMNNVDIHYTCEIDAFHSKTEDMFEVKSMLDDGRGYEINPYVAFLTVLQCHLADVKNILIGFYNETTSEILLKLYSTDDLKIYAKNHKHNADMAIAKMKVSMDEIIDFIRGNNIREKTIKITKNANSTRYGKKLNFEISAS